jgi:hypothetical protein
MVLLVTCLGGVWTAEQPGGSVLEFYPAWRAVMMQIFEAGGNQSVTLSSWSTFVLNS